METNDSGVAQGSHPSSPDPGLVATDAQLAWQQMGLGVFFHFGVNTFAGLEWSDGTLDPHLFDPTDLDVDHWVRTACDLGAGYVVLTAKHHDGFCLWPTRTTDYSVSSSPWRNGHGDLVRELADACRSHGIGLGLYLSPWDRHEPRYVDPYAYDDFYLQQLEELCTNYGPLVEVWFDGAGSAGREYDWERIGELLARTQPEAMVFNMGPATIRWIGNEDGLASDPVEYVTSRADLNNYDDDVIIRDTERYLPPECDVSLRNGWFWQPDEKPKALSHLLAIHDRSVGLGANLLLNIPPDRRGRIDPADELRVKEFAEALRARYGREIRMVAELLGNGHIQIRHDAAVGDECATLQVEHVEIREDLSNGQRVTSFALVSRSGTEVASGGSVGVRRIFRLSPPIPLGELSGAEFVVTGQGARISEVIAHPASEAPESALPKDYRASTEEPDSTPLRET